MLGAIKSILQPPITRIPPGYSEPNRPLCPSSPATFCLRHPTLTCWPFDLEQPNQRPKLSSRRRLLRLEGQLPPTTMTPNGQSASQPVPFAFLPDQRSPSPFVRPTPLQRCSLVASPAWLLRARAIAVADRQPSTLAPNVLSRPFPPWQR